MASTGKRGAEVGGQADTSSFKAVSGSGTMVAQGGAGSHASARLSRRGRGGRSGLRLTLVVAGLAVVGVGWLTKPSWLGPSAPSASTEVARDNLVEDYGDQVATTSETARQAAAPVIAATSRPVDEQPAKTAKAETAPPPIATHAPAAPAPMTIINSPPPTSPAVAIEQGSQPTPPQGQPQAAQVAPSPAPTTGPSDLVQQDATPAPTARDEPGASPVQVAAQPAPPSAEPDVASSSSGPDAASAVSAAGPPSRPAPRARGAMGRGAVSEVICFAGCAGESKSVVYRAALVPLRGPMPTVILPATMQTTPVEHITWMTTKHMAAPSDRPIQPALDRICVAGCYAAAPATTVGLKPRAIRVAAHEPEAERQPPVAIVNRRRTLREARHHRQVRHQHGRKRAPVRTGGRRI